MAKKRLNKKVALIGSAIFVLLVLGGIVVMLHLSRDPEKFVKDGDAEVQAARQATDPQEKQQHYERAEHNYGTARNLAKSDSRRIEILFKAADMYVEMQEWHKVLGCWNEIVSIDSKNVKARFGRLRYTYIMADSGYRVWQDVVIQAEEFIEMAQEADLLNEDTAQWQPPGLELQDPQPGKSPQLGPYLYLLRGRATLELASLGAVTDPDESIAQAMNDLKKAQELEPDNIDAWWYLARAVKTKGEIEASKGSLEERGKAAKQAIEILEQALIAAGADPGAHINLLTEKLIQASRADNAREQIQLLEPEYSSLVQRFPDSPRVHSALARYYQFNPKSFDKAIAAIEKACELDKENVSYGVRAANLHYRKYSIFGQRQNADKAIQIATSTLDMPGAQDKPGPRERTNRNNRVALYVLLANCCIDQVLEPDGAISESKKQELMDKAQLTVHEIEQFFGSGEEPQVIKWQAMLELAKGNKNVATRKLYAAYEQLKASARPDAQLSYSLAKIFEKTTEIGAVREFLESALNAGIEWTKPEAFLDYVRVLLRLRGYNIALSVLNSFENRYWANKKSQELRISAYIGAKQFGEAEKQLLKADANDPNTAKLELTLVQAEITQVQRALAQMQMDQGLPPILQGLRQPGTEPVGSQSSVPAMNAELKAYWSQLAKLVTKLLPMEPDNTMLQSYKLMLAEPEPEKISQTRRREIERQLLSDIADPVRRAINLGVFYQRQGDRNKAAVEFRKVFEVKQWQAGRKPPLDQTEGFAESQRLAASCLFDIAVEAKDWQLVGQIAEVARRENFDNCQGRFFAARVAMAKEDYDDALANLTECLKQRPVFSQAYMLRSRVNAALGNEHASIEDAQKAASLNPLDGTVAKVLAVALFERNRKLGDNVTSDQIIGARVALDTAMSLNLGDLQLLSFYAENVSLTEPFHALAIRQSLQKTAPSLQNALLLGRLATRIARRQANAQRKQALFDIAESAFKQALAIDPQSKTVFENFATYYRARGMGKEAEQLLLPHPQLLWRHYYRSGRFKDAQSVLQQLYDTDAKDPNVLKGFIVVAERTADQEAAKKYSDELILLEDTAENRLMQVQTFLKVGLVNEVEHKLQSLKEKYPDEPGALLFEAWLAMRRGQLKRALGLTNRNLEANQENVTAWRLRGETNRLMANYNQAIEDLRTSLALSDDLTTRIALAKAYLGAQRYDDAITELRSTIADPQAPTQARALLERIYLQLARKGALKRFYDETLRQLPDSVYWYGRAGAFAVAEGKFDSAEQLYAQALQTVKNEQQKAENYGPQQLSAFRSRFYSSLDGYLGALLAGGKLDKVLETGRDYIDGDFAPIAYLRMAEAKLKLNDQPAAARYCRSALQKVGTNEAFASEILRRMYLLLGAEEVSKYCTEMLRTNSDSLAANFTMFNVMEISGQYNKAIGYIDKCLQIIGPNSPTVINYVARKTEVLRQAYNKTSDNNYINRAIAEYESLLAKVPNNIGVLNNLAYMLAENDERLADALTFAENVIKARPNNPGFLDTYAYVLCKNSRLQEADQYMQAAIQQYESGQVEVPPEVYEHLGMIKEKLGAKTEAIAAYKQALEAGADKLQEPVRQRIESAIERLSQ